VALTAKVKDKDIFNTLLVTARPGGDEDIPYRLVSKLIQGVSEKATDGGRVINLEQRRLLNVI
jgi:hypothetical protein